MGAIGRDPHTSTRKMARELHIGKSTVHRVLKQNRFHPYKATTVQELSDDDKGRRWNFTERLLTRIDAQPNFLKHVCFTDECVFHEDCCNFNRHNNHYWAQENPDWTRVTHRQQRWSVNVRMGIIGDHVIGPYFIEGNVNGDEYLNFIEEELDRLLDQVLDEEEREAMYFQQDGHPAHRTRAVVEALERKFPRRWIGLGGPWEWPPRSPDLTLCDCFLWGYMKEKVYEEPRPQNVDELKQRIIQVAATITPEMLSAVRENLMKRIMKCFEEEGGHFEQLL